MNLTFEKTTINDIEKLTKLSEDAFNTDINVGCKSIGGPPGYDSIEFHEKMMDSSTEFYKILSDNKIIGGFWFFKQNEDFYYFARIFIAPAYHRKGVGVESFKFLFNKYNLVKRWTLETPAWNVRTANFYKKIGFKEIKHTEKEIIFEKRL